MALWWVGIDQTDAVRLASKAPFRQQVVLGVSEPLAVGPFLCISEIL
jgi:hypothetical protein